MSENISIVIYTRHVRADYLENVEASTSHKHMGLHGLMQR
jgi:hypothetical protein